MVGLLVLLAVAWRYLPADKTTTTPTPSPNVSGGPGKDTAQHAGPNTDNSSAVTAPTPSSNPGTPASTLPKPIGPSNNVSSVSLSGSTTMESTCRGTVGATCRIEASMNGQKIVVSADKVIGDDGTGGVIFDWDAKKLSVGTWNVVAVLTKAGQTASSDPQKLVVTR